MGPLVVRNKSRVKEKDREEREQVVKRHVH